MEPVARPQRSCCQRDLTNGGLHVSYDTILALRPISANLCILDLRIQPPSTSLGNVSVALASTPTPVPSQAAGSCERLAVAQGALAPPFRNCPLSSLNQQYPRFTDPLRDTFWPWLRALDPAYSTCQKPLAAAEFTGSRVPQRGIQHVDLHWLDG